MTAIGWICRASSSPLDLEHGTCWAVSTSLHLVFPQQEMQQRCDGTHYINHPKLHTANIDSGPGDRYDLVASLLSRYGLSNVLNLLMPNVYRLTRIWGLPVNFHRARIRVTIEEGAAFCTRTTDPRVGYSDEGCEIRLLLPS